MDNPTTPPPPPKPFRVKVPLLTRQSFLDNGVHQLELVLQYGDQEEQVVLVDIHSRMELPAQNQDQQVIPISDKVGVNYLQLNPTTTTSNSNKGEDGESSLRIQIKAPGRRKKKQKCKKICHICNKKFANKHSAASHSLVHLNPEEKEAIKGKWKNKCYFCSKRFKTPSPLYGHLLIHTSERPHPCDKCNKQFVLKGNLISHQRLHDPATRPSFPCTGCGKSFTTNKNLTAHVKMVHQRLKEFQCLECDQKFALKTSMLKHLNAIHYGIRYPCRKLNCDKTFSHKANLYKHEKQAH